MSRTSDHPRSCFTNAPVANLPNEPGQIAAPPVSTFKVVKRDDWSHKALEALLKSHNHSRHCYLAELIILMERYFLGKYLNGQRSHYQQIMPSKRWKPGESLSEKLTRCKDKETFNARFSRIGVTEILRRGHFEDFQIKNVDFKGKLYLRLIDTTRKNVSWFYRNDSAVEAFIDAAHDFYAEQLQSKRAGRKPEVWSRGKAEVMGLRKPEVEDVENPNSLLSSELTIGETNKQRTGLAIIHSSPEENQRIERRPTARKEKSELIEGTTGWQVFRLWRDTLMARDKDRCISAQPTRAQLRDAALLAERFDEYFPDVALAQFLSDATDRWGGLQRWLRDQGGVWQTLGEYPELQQLALFSDKFLTWFKRERAQEAQSMTMKPEIRKKTEYSPPSPEILPPYIGCKPVTTVGRTFQRGAEESLEYQIAAYPRSRWLCKVVPAMERLLQTHSIDLNASQDRIQELKQLPDDEIDQYCC